MSCIVTYISARGGRVIRKGTEPRNPTTWTAKAWFVLASGEKYIHTAVVAQQTVSSLGPLMGALIDSLIEDHGNQVVSAGWTATTHGRKK